MSSMNRLSENWRGLGVSGCLQYDLIVRGSIYCYIAPRALQAMHREHKAYSQLYVPIDGVSIESFSIRGPVGLLQNRFVSVIWMCKCRTCKALKLWSFCFFLPRRGFFLKLCRCHLIRGIFGISMPQFIHVRPANSLPTSRHQLTLTFEKRFSIISKKNLIYNYRKCVLLNWVNFQVSCNFILIIIQFEIEKDFSFPPASK